MIHDAIAPTPNISETIKNAMLIVLCQPIENKTGLNRPKPITNSETAVHPKNFNGWVLTNNVNIVFKTLTPSL